MKTEIIQIKTQSETLTYNMFEDSIDHKPHNFQYGSALDDF